jgi:SNF2 family DNA or RNA helicase
MTSLERAEWRLNGATIERFTETGWIVAPAIEIAEALNEPDAPIRVETGLQFSVGALPALIRISGALPDDVIATAVTRRGRNLVALDHSVTDSLIHDGKWTPIDAASLSKCRQVLAEVKTPGQDRLTLGQYLRLMADPEASVLIADETTEISPNRATGVYRAAIELPILKAELFPYQRDGLAFLIAMATRDVGVLLADQMGLGKTIQAIGLLADQHPRGQSLVVAPASLLVNWRRELEAFSTGLSVLVHAGNWRTGIAGGLKGFDVVITSYDTLMNDFSFLGDVEWNVVALDEAQTVRNPETRRAKTVKALRRRVGVAITGTPVENRLMDLWSIAEFVVPSLLGSREMFEVLFPDETDRAIALGRVIAPITLRRKVADVADDLPDLLNQEIALALPPSIAARYNAVERDAMSAFAATTDLSVICSHADDVDWDQTAREMPKVDVTLQLIDEIVESNEKCLVFASFSKTLDRLFDLVEVLHPDLFLAVVDGRVPTLARQEIIDAFGAFPGSGVLFMNPKAAGVGLNITAANHVIHFNPEWNPATTSQATARAHRRRQERTVTAHHLYYLATVEEDAMVRAEWKRELAAGVDEGTEISDSSLT